MRQKRVRSATDENGSILRDENGHPILTEYYEDKGPRIVKSHLDSRMQHAWARKRYYGPAPPIEIASSWPTPVPNTRRRRRKASEITE